jgi:hypothetical protein
LSAPPPKKPSTLLGIVGGNEEDAEERHARHTSLRSGADALERFVAEDAGEIASAAELRQITAKKLDDSASAGATHLRPRLAMLAAARDAVIHLRDRGEIGDAVMRRLQSEFDHEEILMRQRND